MDYILFKYRPNKSRIHGIFDEDDGNIYINEDLPKMGRELVYAHECQHRTCFYSNCSCYKKNSIFYVEYHAFLAELIFILKINSVQYWKYYLMGVIEELNKFNNPDINGWLDHFRALRKVCKLKAFKEKAKKFNCWKKISKLLDVVE
jgi:hypothetical protein